MKKKATICCHKNTESLHSCTWRQLFFLDAQERKGNTTSSMRLGRYTDLIISFSKEEKNDFVPSCLQGKFRKRQTLGSSRLQHVRQPAARRCTVGQISIIRRSNAMDDGCVAWKRLVPDTVGRLPIVRSGTPQVMQDRNNR